MSSTAQLSQAETSTVSWLQKPWLLPAVACGLVFLVYAGTVRFGFVFDDQGQIVENDWLTSFSYLPRYFTAHVWAFAGINGSYWRPLFLIWLLIQRLLFGVHPAMWHLDSVLLHAAATGLVYQLAVRLTRDRLTSAIAALIFGLHPALIESVAWVSGVTDPLLTVCLVPSFLAFLNWRGVARVSDPSKSEPRKWLAVSLVLYALALMCKETAVALPPLVFLYAWIYSQDGFVRRTRDALLAVFPYVPVTLAYAAVHLLAVQRIDDPGSVVTPVHTLLTAPSLLLFYLRTLLFPAVISPNYDVKMMMAFSWERVVLPMLLLAAVVALLYWSSRRDHDFARLTAFASAWIVLPLLPAIFFLPNAPHDFAHPRYLYLSAIGFGMIVAAAIGRLRLPAMQAAATAAVIISLALGTTTQQLYWANNMTLFSRGVAVAPNNVIALTGLGAEYGKQQRYPEAISLFRRGLAIDANDWHPNFSLGYTYFVLGRYAEAEPLIGRAVSLNPTAHPDALAYFGRVEVKLGDLPRAEGALRYALQYYPKREQFRLALALVLEEEGKLPDAVKELKETLAINPNNAVARARLDRIESLGDSR
jgi:hypothetical protein